MADLICTGCKTRLEQCRVLELKIMMGQLCIECPICKFIQKCKIDNYGNVISIENDPNI